MELEFEVKRITQEEIDNQNNDRDNGQPFLVDDEPVLLQNVKAGDYVSSSDLLIGRDYAKFIPAFMTNLPDEERDEWLALVIQLDKLNGKV